MSNLKKTIDTFNKPIFGEKERNKEYERQRNIAKYWISKKRS